MVVAGDWLPRSCLGMFCLFWAGVRAVYLSLYMRASVGPHAFDVIMADQIAFHLPLLRLTARKILFYCHFPDKLLAPTGGGVFRRGVYRRVLDWGEERCLALGADAVVVNSRFTQTRFAEAFLSLKQQRPAVLYPGVASPPAAHSPVIPASLRQFVATGRGRVFLSLNRFERKKDLHLAVEAVARIPDARLIVAGGYDPRVAENREHLLELETQCRQMALPHATLFRDCGTEGQVEDWARLRVVLLPSVSEDVKEWLMAVATALVYTPSHEHLGLVPLEAMARGLPVIAMNSGGPCETVLDGQTGFLCEADAASIALAMRRLVAGGTELRSQLGDNGRRRVNEHFSFDAFGDALHRLVTKLAG